jgi:hypothetical protein
LRFGEAIAAEDVQAIVLHIDSPGGLITGVHEFAGQIYAARNIKPVVAYISGMGTSAAYWIASAAGRVVADETAILGSIGVVAAWTDDTEARKSTGYEFQLAASPRRNIRIYAVASKADVKKSDLYPIFNAYWAANKDTFAFAANRDLPVVDITNSNLTTVGQTYDALVKQFAVDMADSGGHVRNTREWSGSLAATYVFDKFWLKGFRITGRGVWREAAIIGFFLDSAGKPNADTPIRGRNEYSLDLIFGWQFGKKIARHDVKIDLGLQIYNITDKKDPIYLEANAWSPTEYYINKATLPAPRLITFTGKFSF